MPIMSTFKDKFRSYFNNLLLDLKDVYDYNIISRLSEDIKPMIKEFKEDEDDDSRDIKVFFEEEIRSILLDKLLEIFARESWYCISLCNLLDATDMDIEDILNAKDAEILMREIIDRIFETKHFVDDWDAIRYLSTQDSSLKESLSLASDLISKYSLDIKDLDSCVLANLLYIKGLSKYYNEAENTIRKLLDFKEKLVKEVMNILISSVNSE
jgi:hypothetical protein